MSSAATFRYRGCAFARGAFRSRIVPLHSVKSNIASKSVTVNRTDRLARNPRGKVNLDQRARAPPPYFITKRDRSNEPTRRDLPARRAKAINFPIY